MILMITLEHIKQHFSKEEALAVLKSAREDYQRKVTREHLYPGEGQLERAHYYSKILCHVMALEFQVKRSF